MVPICRRTRKPKGVASNASGVTGVCAIVAEAAQILGPFYGEMPTTVTIFPIC
jgi:hypothetical protein